MSDPAIRAALESAILFITEGSSEHDFGLTHGETGERVANVWHSDKGEWTVEFVDGPVHRATSRRDAIERVARHVVGA